MIKKLLLLAAAASMSFGAFAQKNTSVVVNGYNERNPVLNAHTMNDPSHPALYGGARTTNKGGSGGSKWFSHFDVVTSELGGLSSSGGGGTMGTTLENMWWDSTVRQRYSNGLFSVELGGVGEYIDPKTLLYSNVLLFDSTQIQVTANDQYYVAS